VLSPNPHDRDRDRRQPEQAGGGDPEPSRGGRRRIAIRVVAGALVAALLGWTAFTYLVIMHPSVDEPARADAVVVLGPASEGGVLDEARRLVDRGLAPRMVISATAYQRGWLGNLCSTGDWTTPWDTSPQPAGPPVTCFVPTPGTTQGEARAVTELATANGWHSIIVVTPTYHVARSRLLFERCYGGRLQLTAPPDTTPLSRWAFQAVYQGAAFVKASLPRGC